jgi:GPH family glycoside/pentoside/hexuronide:cation symporter
MSTETASGKSKKTPAITQSGFFVSQALFAAVTCIEIYYFTGFLVDIARIPLGLVAIIKTVTAVLDFAFALLMPVIMQKLRLPLGKYRSAFVIFPAIYAIFGALAISKISDTNMAITAGVIIVSYFISRCLWNLTDASSSVFTSVIAREYPDAQTKLSMWRGRGSASSSLWFGVLAGPLIIAFSKMTTGGLSDNAVWGYTFMALVIFVINIVGYAWLYISTKQFKKIDMEELKVGTRESDAPSVSVLDMLKAVATNKALLSIWVYDVFRQLGMFYGSGVAFFYWTYTLGAPWAIAISVTVGGVGGFLGGFLSEIVVRKLGTKKAILFSMFGGAILGIVMFLIPWSGDGGAWAVMIIRTVTGLALASPMILITKTYADCSTYAEYKTGKDTRATVMSSYAIPIKIMSVIIGGVTTLAIALTGYVAGGEITESVTKGFSFIFFVVPSIFNLIAGVAILFYPADKKFAEYKRVVDERRAAAGLQSTAD